MAWPSELNCHLRNLVVMNEGDRLVKFPTSLDLRKATRSQPLFSLDTLFLEPPGQPVFQSRHRFRKRVGLVVLEDLPAVIDRSDDEPESVLIANLDVTVLLDPFSDGREQPFDVRLLCGCLNCVD